MFFLRLFLPFFFLLKTINFINNMSRIRQTYQAYKTAEINFNKRKVNLKKAFEKEMHECLKNNNVELFNSISEEFVSTLGEEYQFTVESIKILYGIN